MCFCARDGGRGDGRGVVVRRGLRVRRVWCVAVACCERAWVWTDARRAAEPAAWLLARVVCGGSVLRARVWSRKTHGGLRNPPRDSSGNEGRDVLLPERRLEGCQLDSPPGFARSQLLDIVVGPQ